MTCSRSLVLLARRREVGPVIFAELRAKAAGGGLEPPPRHGLDPGHGRVETGGRNRRLVRTPRVDRSRRKPSASADRSLSAARPRTRPEDLDGRGRRLAGCAAAELSVRVFHPAGPVELDCRVELGCSKQQFGPQIMGFITLGCDDSVLVILAIYIASSVW